MAFAERLHEKLQSSAESLVRWKQQQKELGKFEEPGPYIIGAWERRIQP